MVNVLLIGNSARAHALAEVLKRNNEVKLYSYIAGKNPGVIEHSEEFYLGKYDDLESIKEFAEKVKPEFAVVAPEAPLEAGVVDLLEEINIPSFGPKKVLAQLETSKSFTRNIVAKYNIPGNPEFKVFHTMEGVVEFMDKLGNDFVIKYDALLGGKGVKLMGEHLKNKEEAIAYAEHCIQRSGKVVIEEKLVGEEFSLQCITDGKTVVCSPIVQDHKRAYVGDKGPNTGGMGSYGDANHSLPFLTQKDVDEALEITQKVCNALHEEFKDLYKGVMYGGFIATKDGVKLIEYNARFGDPEAINILPLLKTDFTELCRAVINGTLADLKVEFENKATVVKYAVPKGYPDDPVKGEEVDISEVPSNVRMYFASVDREDGKLNMSTSRAIAFLGIADTIAEAEKIAEEGVSKAKGKIFHREDVGTAALIQKRIDHMDSLRQ
jgi:phosphoribosylamine--glycine ligase